MESRENLAFGFEGVKEKEHKKTEGRDGKE